MRRFIIFIIICLLWKAQSVTATSRFIVHDCNFVDQAIAVSGCASYGGLAMPKTAELLAEADSVFSQTCPSSTVCAFWVGAQCTTTTTAQWTDGSAFTVYSPATACGSVGGYIGYLGSYGGSSYSFNTEVATSGVLCEGTGILCAFNYCRSNTTATVYTYQQATSCCLCNATLRATGPQCQCAIGTGGTDCDASGTSTVAYNASSEICSCGCLPTYTGGRCDQRYCTNSTDCSSRATLVSGFSPDCVCQCEKGYGGRNCRQLTTTSSLSIGTESHSMTGSSTVSHFTTCATMTLQGMPSRSPDSTSTLSISPSISDSFTVQLSDSASMASTWSASSTVTITQSTSITYSETRFASPTLFSNGSTPEAASFKTHSETPFERPSQTLYYNGTTPPPEKPIPVAVAAAKKVTTAAGVAVAVTAVASVTGGQLGVANAILRIANCQDANDDDEALPILMHPLQFSFGSDNYENYAAGAISNTLIVPLIVAAIALVPARLLIMNVKGVTSATAMKQIGWPSVLILPFSNLAEGVGVTVLTSFISGETLGIGAALIATSLLLAFTGSWAWILIRVVPNTKMVLLKEEQNASLKKPFLWRIVRPTHRWVPRGRVADEVIVEGAISEGFVEKYINAIGDKQWFYAEFVSFLCSIAVGITESLPSSICKERAIIALVPAFVQCGLSVLSLTPLERVLQSLLTLCLVPMYLVATVKVFNGDPDDDSLDSTLAVFSSAGNAIGIGIMSFGLAVGMWDIATTHRAKMARARRPSRKGRGNRSGNQASPPDIIIPSLTRADTDSDDNLDVPMLPLEANSQEESAISRSQGYRSHHQSRPSDEAAPANPQVHAPIATPSPRTVEDILDFVERAAFQQRIDQTIQHNNNNAFEL